MIAERDTERERERETNCFARNVICTKSSYFIVSSQRGSAMSDTTM